MDGWLRLAALGLAVLALGLIDQWVVAYIWPELYYHDVCTGVYLLGFFMMFFGAHFERLDMQDRKREKAASVEYADWDRTC